MKINIAGQELTISDEQQVEILTGMQHLGMDKYKELKEEYRFTAKAIARGILQYLEKSVRGSQGNEAALLFRPAPKSDATEHLTKVLAMMLHEVLKNATITITTDAHTVTSLSYSFPYTDKSGRQVASHGHIGKRENDGVEVS